MDWGALLIALTSGTAGAFLRDVLQHVRDRRKLAIDDRTGLAGAAHEVAEGAGDVVLQYQRLLEEQRASLLKELERERAHCDRELSNLKQQIQDLRARIAELEQQQSGAVDVSALREGSP